MGVLDKLNPFCSEKEEKGKDEKGGLPPTGATPQSDSATATQSNSADGPDCSVCGEPGADKKWAGQAFHKKCLRKARKMAKGMF